MKKLIAGVAALVIGMGSLFAWTNIVEVGVAGSFPDFITTTGKDSTDYKFNNTGLNLGYIGVFDSNLAVKANTSIGIGSVDAKFLDNFADPELGPINFNATQTLGVGYRLINTDNLFLGLFGNIGASVNCGVAANQDDDYAYANSIATASYFVGADITAMYTPVKTFSIYASLSANAAYGAVVTETVKQNLSYEDDTDTTTHEHLMKPYFLLRPSIGAAWKF